jgi:hypothetical protein
MKYNISEETLINTTKCSHNFRCLRDDDFQVCEPEEYVSDELLFVDTKSNIPCSYKLPFADSCICHCPVRKEIYRKYEK